MSGRAECGSSVPLFRAKLTHTGSGTNQTVPSGSVTRNGQWETLTSINDVYGARPQ